MSRNLAKEAAWEKENYTQFKFRLKKDKANEFKEALEAMEITQSEWFNNEIDNFFKLFSIVKKITVSSAVTCSRCGTPSPTGYVDGYFRCVECEFGNYVSSDEVEDIEEE